DILADISNNVLKLNHSQTFLLIHQCLRLTSHYLQTVYNRSYQYDFSQNVTTNEAQQNALNKIQKIYFILLTTPNLIEDLPNSLQIEIYSAIVRTYLLYNCYEVAIPYLTR